MPSSILLILRGNTKTEDIKSGTFRYSDADSECIRNFNILLDAFRQYPFYKKHRFIRAVLYLSKKDTYNHYHMVKQLSKYGHLINNEQRSTGWDTLYRQILEVYNYRVQETDKIKYNQSEIDMENKS